MDWKSVADKIDEVEQFELGVKEGVYEGTKSMVEGFVALPKLFDKAKLDASEVLAVRVMEIDGKLVAYDNRRTAAARMAKKTEIPIEVLDPQALMPGSKKTWLQAFNKRRNMEINRVDGGPIPTTGLTDLPRIND